MRESIGQTWIFTIVILFIALFAGFLAYAISYTKAFNVKNEILSLIEENEGFTSDEEFLIEIAEVIDQIGYNYEPVECRAGEGTSLVGGYCVNKTCTTSNGTRKVYYKVTAYVKVEIPVIGLKINIPVTGETNTMHYDRGDINLGTTC